MWLRWHVANMDQIRNACKMLMKKQRENPQAWVEDKTKMNHRIIKWHTLNWIYLIEDWHKQQAVLNIDTLHVNEESGPWSPVRWWKLLCEHMSNMHVTGLCCV